MSVPAHPFQRKAMMTGVQAANISDCYAWLQSDTVRDLRVRPTRLEAGPAAFAVLGGGPVLRVPATAANPERFPCGERRTPQDDLTFVLNQASDLAGDVVYVMQQQPPGEQT